MYHIFPTVIVSSEHGARVGKELSPILCYITCKPNYCANTLFTRCLILMPRCLLGARVAWRNAPKCSNRKYWQQLKLLDCRGVDTNRGMFDSCITHLTKAMACGSAEAYITVFRPETPGTSDGPRIWNDQLLQFAAYNQDGHVMGDPKNVSTFAS
jgi:hypothetical protein